MSKTYSSAEAAYRDVKERIITGALPGGELISEGEIAGQLGVSRTPVREAFLRLEAEGWMRLYPKRGALVVPVAEGEAEHVLEARFLVESHSARAVCANPAARARLLEEFGASLAAQEAFREAADLAGFSDADADFHRALVHAAGNPLLLTFYDGLRDRQRRMTARSVTRDPARFGAIVDDHAALSAHVARNDPDGFAAALWTHMRTVHHLPPAPMPGTRDPRQKGTAP